MVLKTNGLQKVNKNAVGLEFSFSCTLVKHLFQKLALWNANAKNIMP